MPEANPSRRAGRWAAPADAASTRKGASAYVVTPPPPVQGEPTQRRRAVPEETPFDPIGIQVGAFNFKPAIESPAAMTITRRAATWRCRPGTRWSRRS